MMINIFNAASTTAYGVIGLLIYVIVEAVKQTKMNNQYLPIVAVFAGGAIGAIVALFYPNRMLLNIAFGALAGFSATGINEFLHTSLASLFQPKEK